MRRHDRLRAHIPVQCAPPRTPVEVGDEDGEYPPGGADYTVGDAAHRASSPTRELQPDVTVASALSLGLAKIGEAAGLEPLAWQALDLGGGPLIEGMPHADSTDPLATCLGWATLLQLREYSYDVGDGMRTWFRVEGAWQIEVSTARD